MRLFSKWRKRHRRKHETFVLTVVVTNDAGDVLAVRDGEFVVRARDCE